MLKSIAIAAVLYCVLWLAYWLVRRPVPRTGAPLKKKSPEVLDPRVEGSGWDSFTGDHDVGERQHFLWTGPEGDWDHVLVRELKLATHEQKMKGWGPFHGDKYWQYYCTTCGGDLTPGPSGGGTNQVCELCRVNYGCLPGGLER